MSPGLIWSVRPVRPAAVPATGSAQNGPGQPREEQEQGECQRQGVQQQAAGDDECAGGWQQDCRAGRSAASARCRPSRLPPAGELTADDCSRRKLAKSTNQAIRITMLRSRVEWVSSSLSASMRISSAEPGIEPGDAPVGEGDGGGAGNGQRARGAACRAAATRALRRAQAPDRSAPARPPCTQGWTEPTCGADGDSDQQRQPGQLADGAAACPATLPGPAGRAGASHPRSASRSGCRSGQAAPTSGRRSRGLLAGLVGRETVPGTGEGARARRCGWHFARPAGAGRKAALSVRVHDEAGQQRQAFLRIRRRDIAPVEPGGAGAAAIVLGQQCAGARPGLPGDS